MIELARKHLNDMPENVACPPGCAECCSGYEPFVSKTDVQRIADHFGLTYDEVMTEYVVARDRPTATTSAGCAKSTTTSPTSASSSKVPQSGQYYCGIYEARPHDCGEFTPIGCDDVDEDLPRRGKYVVGDPFKPKRRKKR